MVGLVVISSVLNNLKSCLNATAWTLLVLPSITFAGQFETDLNGFRLWQYVTGAESHLGKPFKTIEQPDRKLQAFTITATTTTTASTATALATTLLLLL